jgi:hypothetical protein
VEREFGRAASRGRAYPQLCGSAERADATVVTVTIEPVDDEQRRALRKRGQTAESRRTARPRPVTTLPPFKPYVWRGQPRPRWAVEALCRAAGQASGPE